jgi:hypothetical protein
VWTRCPAFIYPFDAFPSRPGRSLELGFWGEAHTFQVDLRKVNLAVLRPWIAQKVTELIRIEDDVVVEYVFGMLEDKDTPVSWFGPETPLFCLLCRDFFAG